VRFENEYVLIYTVHIPRGVTTLWHRHSEDTIYCALRDVTVAETLPDAPARVRTTPCGTAMSRAHREQPLIHQVANAGTEPVEFIAAEARARPARVVGTPFIAAGHHLAWESTRFRAYTLELEAKLDVVYGFYALLVMLTPGVVELRGGQGTQRHELAHGAWLWLEPTVAVRLPGSAHGMLAEWR
jgi:hypothetical protein